MAVFFRSFFLGPEGHLREMTPFDFADTYSRFLVFISDCLRNGTWPTWFPYNQAGLPFFINPQSQLWSPITWLVSLTSGYTLLAAQRQLILTFFFGSLGLYTLAYTLYQRRPAAFVAAVAYAFTSARLCNAQHMDIVNAFALYPWIMWGLLQMARGKRWGTPLLAIGIGMFLVCAYPGVVLLSPLWLGAWTLLLLFTSKMDRAEKKRFVLSTLLASLIGLLIATGLLFPILRHMADVPRGSKLSTEAALWGSLSFSDLTHLLFGVTTYIKPLGAGSDLSMRGLYFGVLPFSLATLAFVHSRDKRTFALAGIFFFALLMSLGKNFFLRVTLHDLFTILNFSRFPGADSRPVAVLFGCLLAGAGVAVLMEEETARPKFMRLLIAFSVVLVAGWVWLPKLLFAQSDATFVAEQFAKVVPLALLFLAVAFVALWRFEKNRHLFTALSVLVALELGMHAPIDAPAFSTAAAAINEVQFESLHKKRFDPSTANKPRTDTGGEVDARNCNSYITKDFSLVPCGPFQSNRFQKVMAAGFRPFLRDGKRLVGFPDQSIPTHGSQFLAQARPLDFTIDRYLPDQVEYTVNVPNRQVLVFNELYFPGWVAQINGAATKPMEEFAGGLRGLTVEAGRHRITTYFSPVSFYIGLVVSLSAWLGVLLWLGFSLRPRRTQINENPARV
jgi:uncharacterized membrane protein YfhO